MSQVQQAIFPGIIVGIILLILISSWISIPPATPAADAQPALAEGAEQPKAAVPGQCSLAAQFPDAVRQWCGLIEQHAQTNSLNPNLVAAVMLQESGGNPKAYSKSGAVGLMQVMPRDGLASSFMCINGPCFASRPSMEQLYDPEYNLAYATRMLADLLRKHGNVRDALKAYGPMDMGYRYADLVISIMNRGS